MDRGVEKIATLVMAVSMLAMTVVIVRLFWRGYQGASTRPSRGTLLVALVFGLIGIVSAVVSLVA